MFFRRKTRRIVKRYDMDENVTYVIQWNAGILHNDWLDDAACSTYEEAESKVERMLNLKRDEIMRVWEW
jgi:hypothetical protein